MLLQLSETSRRYAVRRSKAMRRYGMKSIFRKLITVANVMDAHWRQIVKRYLPGKFHCVYSSWIFQIYLWLCGTSKPWLNRGLHLNVVNNQPSKLTLSFNTSKIFRKNKRNSLRWGYPKVFTLFTVHQCSLWYTDSSIRPYNMQSRISQIFQQCRSHLKNYRCQQSDIKLVPHWGSKNCKCTIKNVVALDLCIPAVDDGNTFRRGTGIHLPSEKASHLRGH